MYSKAFWLVYITCTFCVSQITIPFKRVQTLQEESESLSEKILEAYSMEDFHRSDLKKPLTNFFNVRVGSFIC